MTAELTSARLDDKLAMATSALNTRRRRDALPGKIATKRLVLRAPMRGDVPDLVKLADNKAIASRLTRLPSPYTRADAVGFVEIIAQRPDERPYAIVQSERLLGIVGFSFAADTAPEIGYWLGEPFWGQGMMSEAARALIDAAHRVAGFETIAARALADNDASLNVLKKLGFRRVGERPSTVPHHAGKLTILLELERPRWL